MRTISRSSFIKAFRGLPRFKGDAALGTWLYRITYNACIDELRRRRPAVSLVDDEGDDRRWPDPAPGPAEVAVGRRDLSAALDRLPPDQRAAVLLVDALGLDYEEAAEVLGVRAGTIGSRLSRARVFLRYALDGGEA